MKLRELKRGMKCTYRNGIEFIVAKVTDSDIEYLDTTVNEEKTWDVKSIVCNMKNDLTNEFDNELDIMKVEDITLKGYELVWERNERFTLRLPGKFIRGAEYLNYIPEDDVYVFDTSFSTCTHITSFTQEEIDNLPCQDFIKTLVKELVK